MPARGIYLRGTAGALTPLVTEGPPEDQNLDLLADALVQYDVVSPTPTCHGEHHRYHQPERMDRTDEAPDGPDAVRYRCSTCRVSVDVPEPTTD